MESTKLLDELDNISRTHTLKRENFEGMMVELAEKILAVLKIEQMKVRLFNETRDTLTSIGEYDFLHHSFSKSNTLTKERYPSFFKSAEQNRIVLVENVNNHKVTVELCRDYTKDNNIISLMSIPLRIGGNHVGVMCYEKTGSKVRIFETNEQIFALNVAIVFSSYLEARQRNEEQFKLSEEIKQKDLFLKEVHHRVKNNLSIISSLINLQSGKVKDSYHKSLFDENRSKIDSIALIHKLVYKSKNVTDINISDYICEIATNLQQAYNPDKEKITISKSVDSLILDLDLALPLGLMINEVITNSFKHAFNKQESGHINIGLKKNDGLVTLVIADNGSGLKTTHGFKQSLGMEILAGLADQIGGKYNFENNKGTVFTLDFVVNN